MRKAILKSLGAAAMAVAINAGSLGSADAAVVVTKWDPLYGPPIPNLGWDLQANFYVPNACLAIPGSHFNYSGLDCGVSPYTWGLSSATVQLYDTSSATPTIPIDTLPFGPNYFTYIGIDVAGGIVTGVSTISTPNSVQGASPTLNVDLYNWTFRIGGVDVATLIATAANWNEQSLDPYVCNWDATMNNGAGGSNSDSSCQSSVAPVLVSMITYDDNGMEIGRVSVPEPGSLALVLSALAGAGIVRRRRK